MTAKRPHKWPKESIIEKDHNRQKEKNGQRLRHPIFPSQESRVKLHNHNQNSTTAALQHSSSHHSQFPTTTAKQQPQLRSQKLQKTRKEKKKLTNPTPQPQPSHNSKFYPRQNAPITDF